MVEGSLGWEAARGTLSCPPAFDLLANPSISGRLSRRIAMVSPPGEPADALRDCWVWTGYIDWSGHARLKCNGRSLYVRRLLYEMVAGPVPPDLVLVEAFRFHSRDTGRVQSA